MMLVPTDIKIYLRLEPTDMRKSIDTLSILVQEAMALNPGSGHLFLFRSRKGDKLKALFYEQNAFTLWYRRLEKGKYIFPAEKSGHIEIDADHLAWLLDSDKYSKLSAMAPIHYENYT